MPVDAFIWFKPATGSNMMTPEGETQDEAISKLVKNTKAFEIKDFSFGVENKATIGSATSGAGGGKVQFNEFTIKKTTDSASPAFFKNCCAGAHYETVQLAMRKAGGDPSSAGKPYMFFNFGTVFTTKIDWSGPGDEGPEESITFAYGMLQVGYYKQEASGKMSQKAIMVDWNQMTNKAGFSAAKDEI